jgi:hypothetical protein
MENVMLDRSNLIWSAMSLATISMLVSIAAVVVAVQAGRERDEIAVRRLAIVAPDGTERVILGTIGADPNADTGAYIQVLNNQGAPVVSIVNRQRAATGVSEPTLALCDDHANGVVMLEAGEVVDTSRTPRLWMDGGAGDLLAARVGNQHWRLQQVGHVEQHLGAGRRLSVPVDGRSPPRRRLARAVVAATQGRRVLDGFGSMRLHGRPRTPMRQRAARSA